MAEQISLRVQEIHEKLESGPVTRIVCWLNEEEKAQMESLGHTVVRFEKNVWRIYKAGLQDN